MIIYLKTAMFSIVVPGAATILVPRWLLQPAPNARDLDPLAVAVGALLIAAGAGLYLWCALNIAAFAFVALYEEPTLRRRFGAPYERYLREVPRWLPRKSALPWRK